MGGRWVVLRSHAALGKPYFPEWPPCSLPSHVLFFKAVSIDTAPGELCGLRTHPLNLGVSVITAEVTLRDVQG